MGLCLGSPKESSGSQPAGGTQVPSRQVGSASVLWKIVPDPMMEASRKSASRSLDDSLSEGEVQKIANLRNKGKRGGVSAAHLSSQQIRSFARPIYEKSAEERAEIQGILGESEKLRVLFGHLEAKDVAEVVEAMHKLLLRQGDAVIRQGEPGDAFYIVSNGRFDIFVKRSTQTPGDAAEAATRSIDRVKVMEAGPGASFGELALLYNAPRAASVICVSEQAEVWALDRDCFQIMLVSAQSKKVEMYEGWLADVLLFNTLNRYELGMLSDCLQSEPFDGGEIIIQQGDPGDKMYILEDGECKAYIGGEMGEMAVKHYQTQGDYFGEISLLKKIERQATVRAGITGCSVLVLKKQDFDRVIGPIADTLLRLLDAYPQYRAFLEPALEG